MLILLLNYFLQLLPPPGVRNETRFGNCRVRYSHIFTDRSFAEGFGGFSSNCRLIAVLAIQSRDYIMRILEIYISIAAGLILVYLLVTNYEGTESLFNSISKLNFNAVQALQGKASGGFVQ